MDLPPQPGGWSWEADSITALSRGRRDCLRRRLRDTEADIAEESAVQEWVTVIDGPLHFIRCTRALPVIGYAKTPHRPMLVSAAW